MKRNEANPSNRDKIMVLVVDPIELVKALSSIIAVCMLLSAMREDGYETIMVNS